MTLQMVIMIKKQILKSTNSAAVLTESGFYTNKAECKKMMGDKFREFIALIHFTAMLEIEETPLF